MFTMITTQRIFVLNNDNAKTTDRETRKRAVLKTKLKKALQFCDITKDDPLSSACVTLWEEIDELSQK